MATETEKRAHGGLLLVAWLHQAPPQGSTHSVCTAAHTAQAGRQTGSIFESDLAGWLVLDGDDIRTHSHGSTVQSKRLA